MESPNIFEQGLAWLSNSIWTFWLFCYNVDFFVAFDIPSFFSGVVWVARLWRKVGIIFSICINFLFIQATFWAEKQCLKLLQKILKNPHMPRRSTVHTYTLTRKSSMYTFLNDVNIILMSFICFSINCAITFEYNPLIN